MHTRLTIEPRQPELDALYARTFGQSQREHPKAKPSPGNGHDLSDTDLIERARRARNGDRFARLWAGDINGYPSASEADLALCSMLAFWTDRDASRIDRLFCQSGLCRQKWEREDYRNRTIEHAIAATLDGYHEHRRAKRTSPAPDFDRDLDAEAEQRAEREAIREEAAGNGSKRRSPQHVSKEDKRPFLNAADGDLPRITNAAWAALVEANDPPRLFRFASLPTRIERTDDNVPVPRVLTAERLRRELGLAACWYKPTTEERRLVLPPLAIVINLLATPEPPLPILRRIVEVPTFGADRTLLLSDGYHPGAKVFYCPAPGFVVPPVPECPSEGERATALDWIVNELLGDFPFAGDAERAHAVALLLLPFVRELIDGPTPLFLIEKPTPGTGAGLLVDALLIPSVGRAVATMTEGRDEDEWRKRILAKLRTSPPVVVIDNLRRRLDSAAVASAITSTVMEDRILGLSEMAYVPVRCVWIATGNNPALSAEMTRRTVRIRLDAGVEQPWRRTGFRHPDLRDWTLAHRQQLVWSALVLAQSWIAAGSPTGRATLGMFEAWSRVTEGVLSVAGVPGFLTNLDDLYGASNAEDATWHSFVTAWWQRHQDAAVRVADLFDLVTAPGFDINLDLGSGGDRSQHTRLGALISRQRDRRFGDYRIINAGTEHHAQLWKLQPCT